MRSIQLAPLPFRFPTLACVSCDSLMDWSGNSAERKSEDL